MFFAWDITILANTLETSPKTQILKITTGVITRLDIKFPAGCHGMVKVRILKSEFQLVPLSKGEWVTGDGEPVLTQPNYEVTGPPTELKFIGCSPGTIYNHVITVRINIERAKEEAATTLSNTLKRLLDRLGV